MGQSRVRWAYSHWARWRRLTTTTIQANWAVVDMGHSTHSWPTHRDITLSSNQIGVAKEVIRKAKNSCWNANAEKPRKKKNSTLSCKSSFSLLSLRGLKEHLTAISAHMLVSVYLDRRIASMLAVQQRLATTTTICISTWTTMTTKKNMTVLVKRLTSLLKRCRDSLKELRSAKLRSGLLWVNLTNFSASAKHSGSVRRRRMPLRFRMTRLGQVLLMSKLTTRQKLRIRLQALFSLNNRGVTRHLISRQALT